MKTAQKKEPFEAQDLLEAAYATAAKMHCKGQDLDDAAQEFCLYALQAQERADDNREVRAYQWSYGMGGVKKHIQRVIRWSAREKAILNTDNDEGKQCHEAVAPREDDGERLDNEDNLNRLPDALRSLTPQQRMVVEMRFFNKAKLETVGKLLGVSKERARQIETEALTEMRSFMQN